MTRATKTKPRITDAQLNELVDRAFAGTPITDGEDHPVGLARRAFGAVGNSVADSGDLFAELGAGFKAAAFNYGVAKNAALERQKQRTKARLAAYVAMQ